MRPVLFAAPAPAGGAGRGLCPKQRRQILLLTPYPSAIRSSRNFAQNAARSVHGSSDLSRSKKVTGSSCSSQKFNFRLSEAYSSS